MIHISTGAFIISAPFAYSPLKAWWFWNAEMVVLLPVLLSIVAVAVLPRGGKP